MSRGWSDQNERSDGSLHILGTHHGSDLGRDHAVFFRVTEDTGVRRVIRERKVVDVQRTSKSSPDGSFHPTNT